MNIFLDMGAYDGLSAEFIRKYHPAGDTFKIFSFECDRRNIEKLRARNDLNIELIEKAVTTHDNPVNYFYGKDDGGSLYSSKKTGNIRPDVFETVEGIDIARFISENCKKEDYIIAKLNIEGAEYKIIPHLHRCELIPWVDKWFVQWHWQKIRLSEDYHKYVVSLLPEWHPWECQLSAKKFAPIFLNAL